MRRFRLHVVLVGVLLLAFGVGSYAIAGGGKKHLKADDLTGYQENPDISSVATGSFTADIDDDAPSITYKLSYDGLEGNVTQAHVHFGKRAVNGGVSFFLCGTAAAAGPMGTPTCPQSGTVERTIGPADVIGPGAQGIDPGQFEEIVAAMRAGHAYANVHSTKWPGGEIRAQINDRDADN